MHYHLEVVMPPTDDVEAALDKALEQFDENEKDEEGQYNSHAFWDWWVVGGRWAADKITQSVNPDHLEAFYKALNENEVTVSSLQAGKQRIEPESQVPLVDKLWREICPGHGEVCPLFTHYNNQYENSKGYPDVMRLGQLPKKYTTSKVLITNHEFRPMFMIEDKVWNGVNFVDTVWDGTVDTALRLYNQKLQHLVEKMREKNRPTEDWISVTVDYHS